MAANRVSLAVSVKDFDWVVIVDAHTSYPILRHHSIISGMAVLFMPMPDFLIASTIVKLLCNVLRAATASYDTGELRHTHGEKLLLAHYICAACHFFCRGE